ncbi:MAG TPA: hypothetical protein VK982_03720 [Bacteroidales bacterium]|nr:hypothetical protein [Bacteroidales bacterium]
MNWSKVYNKNDELKLINKINDIARCLKRNDKHEISLFGGKIGISLFFMYYAKYVDNQEPYDYAMELLLSVFDDINHNGYNFHTHASGLAGISTTFEILAKEDFIEANTEELLIDCFLIFYIWIMQSWN